MIEGVDVSRWQVDTPDLDGLGFLIARATYGADPDVRYPQHARAARARGIALGAYHFGRNLDVGRQLAAFRAAIARVRPDFVALDLEADRSNAPMSDRQARAFLAGLRHDGWSPGLYASALNWPGDLGQAWDWVADWRGLPRPTRPFTFWQYRGFPLDLDRFNGDITQLRRFAGLEGPPMTTFAFDETAAFGTVTVHDDEPHGWIRLRDSTLHEWPSTWGPRLGFGPVRFDPPFPRDPSKPNADRTTGYVVGSEAAGLLATDVDFERSPAVDRDAVLDEAIAAVVALKGG